MPKPKTLGSALLALKDRSGLTLAQIASLAGYRSASAIQRFFNDDYAPAQPSRTVGRRLATALGGKGHPAIEEAEVLGLYGDEQFIKDASHTIGGGFFSRGEFIPLTSAAWVPEGAGIDGLEKLEVFVRKHSGTRIRKPEHLSGLALAGFFVPVSGMWPRYEVGQFVVFDATKPARAGDYAVVRFSQDIDKRALNFLARIDRIDTTTIHFQQFNPSFGFAIPVQSIDFMARIVGSDDLLPPIEAKDSG